MSVLRRPRPTLRVIREDLTEGWEDPGIRSLAPNELSPLADLPHPLLRSISDHCADLDDVREAGKGWIRSTPPEFRLREIRMSQYRAGIWVDDGGTPWICTTGLAKGNHEDYEDFYRVLERTLKNDGARTLRPTDEDRLLLKREWVAETLTKHELRLQREITAALHELTDANGGDRRLQVPNPLHEINPEKQPNEKLFEMQISIAFDEKLGSVEITANFVGDVHSQTGRSLKAHALLTIERHENPRVTVYKEFHEFIIEIEPWLRHLADLEELNARCQAVDTLPPQSSHFLHKPDIADGTVNGGARRTLCGMFIVPLKDPGDLPVCPKCAEWHALLPE
ncbi:DUF3039 domain-containing protein [Corynebacterium freneyi]|uniref:DUF3039 domain-containing protein n=1 Tax=Corynebacterium freneyi TaxID=134034 RepID=UPI000A05669C|nr:DUF3039 domain-containing protein [Corynebacterium freneyi]